MQADFSTIFGGLEPLGKHDLARFVLNPNASVRSMFFDPLDGIGFAVKFHALKLPIGEAPCRVIFFAFHGSKVQRFTCTHAHFDVRRPAKCTACDGDGKGKQCHKGKGKEGFADHAAPLSGWFHLWKVSGVIA
jgi:hypothetical protein